MSPAPADVLLLILLILLPSPSPAATAPGRPPRRAHALLVLALARRVDQHGLVLANDAAAGLCARLAAVIGRRRRRLGFLVELLDELGLDLAAALLPPRLFGGGLGFNLLEALAELGVAGDFVRGLENGRAPVGSESVGLFR